MILELTGVNNDFNRMGISLSITRMLFDLRGCKLFTNPNTETSPKHAARGVAQSPYPIYSHGETCWSKQLPLRAAGDPRLARGRSQVRAPAPTGALRAFSLQSSLPSSFGFFAPSPPPP